MRPSSRSRLRALVRLVTVLPAWVRQAAIRALAVVLWPVAWVGAVALGRPPAWWLRYGWWVTRAGARTRAYAWLLTDRPPRRAVLHHVAPDPATTRLALLLRPLGLPWFLILRYFVSALAVALSVLSWPCLVVARRQPRAFASGLWQLNALAIEIDCWLLLVGGRRPRLPEPDPRLNGRPLGDHQPLVPWRRRTGYLAIGVDLVAGLIVSVLFAGVLGLEVWDVIVVTFIADLCIQAMQPYLGIYLASQEAPISVRQFGLHVLHPFRSLAAAVGLMGVYAILLMATAMLAGVFVAETDSGGGIVPDGASTTWTIVFVAIGTVIAPIFEEFFYRGFMFQALRQGRGTWTAAGISSLAFAAAHLEFAPAALIDRAAIGIGLCWLFAKTGRLLPGMFAHSINNAIVIPLVIGWTWQIAIVLPGSLLVITCIAFAVSRLRPVSV